MEFLALAPENSEDTLNISNDRLWKELQGINNISLSAFAASELDVVFSGYQPR
jgi:hypothetical protein